MANQMTLGQKALLPNGPLPSVSIIWIRFPQSIKKSLQFIPRTILSILPESTIHISFQKSDRTFTSNYRNRSPPKTPSLCPRMGGSILHESNP